MTQHYTHYKKHVFSTEGEFKVATNKEVGAQDLLSQSDIIINKWNLIDHSLCKESRRAITHEGVSTLRSFHQGVFIQA